VPIVSLQETIDQSTGKPDIATVAVEFTTKILIPQSYGDVIHRQRLLDLLHNGIALRIQVVSAPAGYGKTTLLADFASDIDTVVCWYSLDTSDQDPWMFLEGLLSSIRFRFPDFGRITGSQLSGAQDVSEGISQIMGTLTREIYNTIPEYFVLVVEDYHLIQESSAARDALDLLVQNVPENIQLILSSRTAVNLPTVSSLVVRRQAASYGVSELSFTPTETRELSAVCHGLQLSEEEASKLAADTEGWAIGIMANSHSADEERGCQSLSVLNKEDVFRYLEVEVFNRQPTEIKKFLLFSSTLSSIEPQVCDYLLSIINSRMILHKIEKQNLFTQCLNPEKGWYRYHHLFREFLQDKLLMEDPECFRSLHSAAARILEESLRWNEAITHYLCAGRYDEALRVVKVVGEEFQNAGKWSTVSKWIDALPATLRASDPDLLLLEAQSLIHLGAANKAARLLTRLLSHAQTVGRLYQAKALSWRSAAFRITGHFTEAKKDAEGAVRLLEESGGLTKVLGDAYRRLGNVHAEQGRFPEALSYMKRALECYTAVFNINHMADVHNSIGIVHKRLGDLVRASIHFEYAREGWQKAGNIGALAMALTSIGYIYQRQGQFDLALETIQLGLEKARETGYKRIEACALIAMAEVLRDLELYDDALASYHEGLELARVVLETYYVMWAKAGIGETYRLLGNYDKANVLLQEAILQAEEQGQKYEEALFSIQVGIIEYERGQYETATSILQDVYECLEDKGDKDAVAKVCFHLAQVSFLSRKYDIAIYWLEKTSRLADELGYDSFLTVEGRRATLLVEFGASRNVGGCRFTRVMERIRNCRNSHAARLDTSLPVNPSIFVKPDIEVYMLGEARVLVNSRLIKNREWRSNRAKELFFYLLCCDTGQTKEQITSALWPDLSPSKGTSNFHINLYRARRAIAPMAFTVEQGSYRLNPNLNLWVDIIEFKNLFRRTDSLSQNNGSRTADLERMVELYAGPFLKNFYGEWVLTQRRQLEDNYLKALSLLAKFHYNDRRYDSTIEFLEKLISLDAYQEEAYYLLMECHLTKGDRGSALLTYRRYLNTVVSELGIDPSARIQQLQRRALIG